MKDSGRQKDRQRWERKEWASLVEKHPRRVKASPWGPIDQDEIWHVAGTHSGLVGPTAND